MIHDLTDNKISTYNMNLDFRNLKTRLSNRFSDLRFRIHNSKSFDKELIFTGSWADRKDKRMQSAYGCKCDCCGADLNTYKKPWNYKNDAPCLCDECSEELHNRCHNDYLFNKQIIRRHSRIYNLNMSPQNPLDDIFIYI